MPKLNHLLKYFIRWPFWAIIISNLLSMVSMITSICFLPNSKMNLVTLWKNSSQFSFFISFSVAASASLVETKSKNFSIVFSSGDLSGILSHPSFLILFLQLLLSVLGNIHWKQLILGIGTCWECSSELLPHNTSKLCPRNPTFILSAHDYTFPCAIATFKFAFLQTSFFPFATQKEIKRGRSFPPLSPLWCTILINGVGLKLKPFVIQRKWNTSGLKLFPSLLWQLLSAKCHALL